MDNIASTNPDRAAAIKLNTWLSYPGLFAHDTKMRSNVQLVSWIAKITKIVSRAHGSPWFHAGIDWKNSWPSLTRGVMKCILYEYFDCMEGHTLSIIKYVALSGSWWTSFTMYKYVFPTEGWTLQRICNIVSVAQKARVHKLIMYAWEFTDFTEGRWLTMAGQQGSWQEHCVCDLQTP